MKSINSKFQNGHLVDQSTGKTFFLRDGSELIIIANERDLITENPLFNAGPILASQEKLESLNGKYKHAQLVQILKTKQELVFRVGLGSRQEHEHMEYLFKCVIYEDLFMFGTGAHSTYFKLCKCACATIDCIEGGKIIHQPIPAISLNQLYNKTVSYLFPLQRSGAGNVFKEYFVLEDGKDNINLLNFRKLKNLDTLRDSHVEKKVN